MAKRLSKKQKAAIAEQLLRAMVPASQDRSKAAFEEAIASHGLENAKRPGGVQSYQKKRYSGYSFASQRFNYQGKEK